MSIQNLDTNTSENTKYVNVPPANDRKLFYDSRCNFMLSNDMLLRLHQLTAAKHYKSMSVLIRDVMEQYLKTEGI
jgi:hypothetical protein